jgi:hypothetical protein
MRMLPMRALAMLTILAIAGTLTACGRYGSPVRPLPTAANETGAATETGAAAQPETAVPPDADGPADATGAADADAEADSAPGND